MKRVLLTAITGVLGLGLLLPPGARAAGADHRTATAPVSTSIQPPMLVEPRLREGDGDFVVDVAALLDSVAGGSAHNRAQVQVAVRSPADGEMIIGPHVDVPVTRLQVGATVALTPEQNESIRNWRTRVGAPTAARMVMVGIRHEADVNADHPGIDAQAVDARLARWQGAEPVAPIARPREIGGTVNFANTTPNPLILLAGPANCMYDTNYPLNAGDTPGSDFLAQLNGALLMPGVTLTTKTTKSSDTQDSRYATTSSDVLNAYASAVSNNYAWFKKTATMGRYLPDLPALSTLPPEITGSQAQLIQTLLQQQAQDSLEDDGAIDQLYIDASMSLGFTLGLTAAFEVTADVPGIDQVLAIIEDIMDVFLSSCSGTAGAFVAGATDAKHPWRQFIGLYDWAQNGKVNPQLFVAPSGETAYQPYSNGMVARVFTTPMSTSTALVTDDQVNALSTPASDPIGATTTFSFAEPDLNAEYPAEVSINGRTVTCGLNPKDAAGQTAAMGALTARGTQWFLTQYPQSAWQRLTDVTVATSTMPTRPSGVDAYVDAVTYLPTNADGLVSVYTSPDGTTWDDPILIPKGGATVTIPSSRTARLVQCTVQSIETWNNPVTVNGRRVVMGTRIMSDMVLGPDA